MNDLDELINCPVCNSEQAWEECLLGLLGGMICFRCRHCGASWTEENDETDANPIYDELPRDSFEQGSS